MNKIFRIKLLVIAAFFICAFNRSDYGNGWLDADKDCQNTREEVLISESIDPVVMDEKKCTVKGGRWMDKYSGVYISDPKKLDIDHLVPLAEVDRSGGNKWTKEKKIYYANDLKNKETLIAVSLGQNRAKGDKDPSEWLPKNKSYHCQYIKDWVKVKKIWNLEMDKREKDFIEEKLKDC